MKKVLKSILKKLTAVAMIVFIGTEMFPVYAMDRTEVNDTIVNVVISEDEQRTIIAQVPKSQEKEYKEKLKSESFRKEEISKLLQNENDRALPEGNIIAQRCMYFNDVKATANRLAGYEAFQEILADKNTRTRIARLLKLTGCGSIITFVSKALVWSGSDLLGREISWWNDSVNMIIDREISCVRVTHIENTKPTYPAAYLIIERI